MAKASEQEHTGSTLARAGKRKWGYDTTQVDEFLNRIHELYEADEPRITQEEIQNTAFALQKDGYKIDQVDAALRRLENAVVDKQTQWDINRSGRIAWQAQTQSLAATLLGRADRDERQRFADGASRNPSYDRKQVDAIVSQIARIVKDKLDQAEQGKFVAELSDAENGDTLTAEDIANVVFTQRKGKHGYAERQVDAYLNRAVQVFSRWESYNRVADLLTDEGTNAAAGSETEVIPPIPLFPQATVDSGASHVSESDTREYGYANTPDTSSYQSQPASPATTASTIFSNNAAARSDIPSSDSAQSSITPQDGNSASSDRSAFEDIRRQEQALFTPAPVAERTSIFSANTFADAVEQAQRVDTSQTTLNTGVESLNTGVESVAQSSTNNQSQQTTHISDDVSEARTTSFVPVFDEPKPDYNAELQQAAAQASEVQQDDSSNGNDKVKSDATPWALSDTDWRIDVPESDTSTKTPKADSSSSPDDYFSKLLDMDTVESTDFHIPSLTFPDTDTVQPAQQHKSDGDASSVLGNQKSDK